uniref:hypothetical protein n=1 Tax=Acetatifactor sp. TaxID=1872090 RepID=UPI004056C11E
MKRKWTIFKEYYLVKSIFLAILVVGVIYFCYDRMNQKHCALQVIMMDVRCSMEQQEEFETEVGKIIGMDFQREYVDISFCESAEMLLALMANDKVDIFLMNNSYFEMMLPQECLYSLDEVMTEELERSVSVENTDLFKGEDGKVYGVSVCDHSWMKQYEFVSTDDVIIGIVENGPNLEKACTFVKLLLTE